MKKLTQKLFQEVDTRKFPTGFLIIYKQQTFAVMMAHLAIAIAILQIFLSPPFSNL